MGKPFRIFVIGLLLFTLGGCAGHDRYLKNPDTVDKAQFERDFAECETSAEAVQSRGLTLEQEKFATNMALRSFEPSPGGVAGAVALGFLGGFMQLNVEKQQLIRQCLVNKGYKLRWYGLGEDPVQPARPLGGVEGGGNDVVPEAGAGDEGDRSG